jgi:hypothetical protein
MSHFDPLRTLPLRHPSQAGGFTCCSEQTGLTCFNAAQHGFSLSRAAQRMF